MLFSKKSREDDGLKTGEGVNAQAQKIADAMVARKMRGISKEELAMFKQYKEEFLEFLKQKGIEPETAARTKKKQ